MAGKGQVMAEELKGQLAEAVPGMVQVFAKATGKTEQELFDAMKKGALKICRYSSEGHSGTE